MSVTIPSLQSILIVDIVDPVTQDANVLGDDFTNPRAER